MANIRFLYENRYPAATLTASSELSAMPVEQSQTTDRSNAWRSETGTVAQTIDIDLGAVLAVTSAALANVTLLGAGVVELYQCGDAGSPGAAVLVATFAAQNTLRKVAAVFFDSQSHRHWQFRWTNPTAASGYAELGYAFLGTYDEPAVNVRVPIPMSRMDPSIGSQSTDGQKSFALRTKFQAGAWVFDAVSEAQHDQVEAMFDAIGVAEPLFVVLDTNLAWTTWLVRVSAALPTEIEPQMAIGRYGVQVPWEEVR